MTDTSQTNTARANLLSGAVLNLLKAEGLVVFVLGTALYFQMGGGWVMYLVLFLAPDLSMAGYAAGPRVGAIIYNTVHTYVGPAVLAGAGYYLMPELVPFALIWAAHIGMDRVCAYGLKYSEAFASTHLNQSGG